MQTVKKKGQHFRFVGRQDELISSGDFCSTEHFEFQAFSVEVDWPEMG